MLDGVARGSAPGGNLDLPIDRGQMGVDGAGTDDHLFGNLGVGQPLCHQAQHFDLSRRQSAGIGR